MWITTITVDKHIFAFSSQNLCICISIYVQYKQKRSQCYLWSTSPLEIFNLTLLPIQKWHKFQLKLTYLKIKIIHFVHVYFSSFCFFFSFVGVFLRKSIKARPNSVRKRCVLRELRVFELRWIIWVNLYKKN